MENKIIYKDLGLINYQEAWDYQESLFKPLVDYKAKLHHDSSIKSPDNYLLFCEHPHVYTLGKNGAENNLLINYIQLQAKNATFYKIDRGGDITYHGPGQIVGYPIIDLERFHLSVKKYVHLLEEATIKTLAHYNIEASRLDGATGVWLEPSTAGKVRKICAIGIKVSRYITMHGFAFNVNTDLSYFNHINPCGFTDKGVTSMQKELNQSIDMNQVKELLKSNLYQLLIA